MANALFVAYRNGQLGSYTTMVDLDTDTIKLLLVDHGTDTPLPASDSSMTDILSGARNPASQGGPSLASRTIGTVAAGVFDAADTVFTSVSGVSQESLVMYKATGTDSTSLLVAFWDTATGLPVTPNGGNITVVWAAGGIVTN